VPDFDRFSFGDSTGNLAFLVPVKEFWLIYRR